MSSIKFNYLTNEIEFKGSESFIESNFDRIQDLLIESLGVKRKLSSSETHEEQKPEPVPLVIKEESQPEAALPTPEPSIPEISQEIRATRPPLRKYIRKVGIPGHEKISIQVAEQKPNVISIASLKEKFGLPDSQIEGVIRDAEKLGKIRRTANGSYVWSQD
jgi:hypothetical protein